MNETNIVRFNKRAVALAIASCMVLLPMGAGAAGLGKLTVLSALGQPLRAEVEVSASKDELSGMTVRLAPIESFKQAGVDYSQVLGNLRFNLERRDSGQAVVKVTSHKPISEPFLDFLVELNWSSGRLLREYTFLLDPPEIADPAASRAVVDARVVETVQGGGAADFRPMAAKPPVRQAAPARPAPTEKSEATGQRVVKRGDSLHKIATETRYEGVSLEQMLITLFRSNPDAFVGQNINRLKEGAILSVPERSQVEALSQGEARKTYLAQTGDWKNYRQKLAAVTAAAPAKDPSESTQLASGKVTAKVDDKALPADKSKDQLKVGRSEGSAKTVDAARPGAQDEERVAREKAYKEAQERLLALEKNVADLQKVLELKNQKLAELQQAPVKKDEPKPMEPTPAPVAVAAEPKKTQEPTAGAAVPEKAAEAVPEAPKPAVDTPPPVPKPAPAKPKPVTPPPPPPPEPDLVDALLEDPLPLLGGAGLLAALLGGFAFYRRRGIKESPVVASTTPIPSSLGPNSVFRMTGGQSVDTANVPLQTGEFSQTGPGMIDTDEVDPVAEADVYIAYGRDTQAEEILLEALNKDPRRTAIHAKLLEIYATRGSLKQFETLASELYAQTDGMGQDWAKVAVLGAKLDPENPLYFDAAGSGDPTPSRTQEPVQAPVEVAPPVPDTSAFSYSAEPVREDFSRNTLVLTESVEPEMPALEPVAAPVMEPVPVQEAPASGLMTLDFDMGAASSAPVVSTPAVAEPLETPAPPPVQAAGGDFALDFDLGVNSQINAQPSSVDFDLNPVAAADAQALAFSSEGTMIMPTAMTGEDVGALDLGDLVTLETSPAPEVKETAPMPSDANALSFDFDMGVSQVMGQSGGGAADTLIANSASFAADAASAVGASVMDLSPAQPATGSLDFDVDLGESVFMSQSVPQQSFDMGSIDLDLATGSPAVSSSTAPVGGEPDSAWDEASTKLDLAKAYQEIGDAEGAKELLGEVAADGPAELAQQARDLLGRLGA